MRILGIETSCDETAIAVIDVSGRRPNSCIRVLANVVASQVKLHAKFGGVVPHLAKREHQKNLVLVLLAALREAGLIRHPEGAPLEAGRLKDLRDPSPSTSLRVRMTRVEEILEREPDLFARMVPKVLALKPPKIDAIAVTVGPGLAPALWVGVNFAKVLTYLWKKPIIAVNHLEGHIYTNLLPERIADSGKRIEPSRAIRYTLHAIRFPALCLIVSGGHTELVLMRGYGKYRVIGETLDDAAGEAFDKVAKMLGLGFPGGPIISKLAEAGNPQAFNFPRPMMYSKDFNFSFSGLKTAVLYKLREKLRNREIGKLSTGRHNKFLGFLVSNFCASFEQAVVNVLVAKTVRAARQFRVKTVMIGGGVAANKKLRAELGDVLRRALPNTYYLTPNTSLTGDNALMIAFAGWFNRNKKTSWKNLEACANLRLGKLHK